MRNLVALVAAAGLALTLSACDEKMGSDAGGQQLTTTPTVAALSGPTAPAEIEHQVEDSAAAPQGGQESGVAERFPHLKRYFDAPVATEWRAGLTCGEVLSDPTGQLLTDHVGRIASETGLSRDAVFEEIRGYCATVGQDEDDVSLALFLANGYALDPHGQVPITADNVGQVGCGDFTGLPAAEKDELLALLRSAHGSDAEFAEYRHHATDMCSVFPTNGILIGLLTPKEAADTPVAQIAQRYPHLKPHFKYLVPAEWRAGLTCQEVLADDSGAVLRDAAPRLASQLNYTPQHVADAIEGYCDVLGQPEDDVSLAVHLALSYSLWPDSLAEVTEENVGQVGCETFSQLDAAERDELFARVGEEGAVGYQQRVTETCAAHPTNAILLALIRP